MAAVTSIGSVTSLTVSNDPTSGNSLYFFSVSMADGGVTRGRLTSCGCIIITRASSAKRNRDRQAVQQLGRRGHHIADQGTNYLIQTPQLMSSSTRTVQSRFRGSKCRLHLLQDDPRIPSNTIPPTRCPAALLSRGDFEVEVHQAHARKPGVLWLWRIRRAIIDAA